MTFAEELVNGYGNDADITSILDHAEVYLLFHANPDGRAIAEVDEGILWRRNTNPNGFVCTKFGVDLNRNYPFMWDFDNPNAVVSDNPCDDTYRGPSAGSEPETMAVADFGRSIFPMAQWPPDIVNVAVDEFTAKGVYLDVHAYGKMILWPFAHEGTATQLTLESPNDLGFETIARKFKVSKITPGALNRVDDFSQLAVAQRASLFRQ
jgi:carboxypeptidase T